MKRYRIAIIGAGCSGLFLANLLNDDDMDVCIFEKNNKIGKKILASGNGKCNLTNLSDLKNKYNNVFANKIIEQYDVDATLNRFKEMGLVYKNDNQGRCYPVSECASSVLDCLKLGLKHARIFLDCEVKCVYKKDEKYILEYDNTKALFDFVVFCSGSAASNLGSYKAYQCFSGLNIKIEELRPSLVPVRISENISSLKGVRVKATIKLANKLNKIVYQEDGEILFRDNSLSGIALFNISSYINRIKDEYRIIVDLSAGMNRNEIYEYINSKKEYNISNLFKGFLNDKLAEYIINKNNIEKKHDLMINKLVDDIFNLTFTVTGLYAIEEAQVCCGGVSLDEVDENLELKKYKNLYTAGEVLNIDGISGGYNMQFAWSSAGVIAKNIKYKIKKGVL